MNEIIIAVVTAACTAVFTGGITLLWKRAEKKLNDNDKEQEQQEANAEKVQKGIVDNLELLKRGIQIMLRGELARRCEHYTREGYCSREGKVQIKDIYDIYHALGKNGIMDSDVHKVMDLPPSRTED